jgi:hypothetical protein
MLRIASGCATREAFISVFRRFCDRESIFIATRTPKDAGADLQFSITLADGAPLIAGTGTVLDSWSDATSPYGRAGMRIRFDDLSPSGRSLIDELVASARQEESASRPTVPVPAAARALAALAKAGTPATPPPTPSVPAIKPLPSVIPKRPGDPRNRTMLGMTPLKRPAKLEATPAPLAMPAVARDVEVKLPPPLLPAPGSDDSDDQTTGVASRFTPDTAFLDEASWDEAADHVLGGTRTKGSHLVLPANPLGGVESASLDAFVECTLYEETGTFALETEATTPGGPPHPDDYAQDDLTIPPWLQGPVADSPFTESIAVPPAMLPLEPEARPTEKQLSSQLRARLVDAGKAFDPSKVPVADPILRGGRRGHWPLTISIAVATGLAGIAIGALVLRGGGDDDSGGEPEAGERAPIEVASAVEAASPAPAAARTPTATTPEARPAAADTPGDLIAQPKAPAEKAPAEKAPAEIEPAEKEPAPAEVPVDEADDTPSAAAGGPVEFSRLSGKLAKDRCGAEIQSRPDKTDVFIGDTRIGATPLKVVLPCGSHALELRRSRYAPARKSIDLDKGKLDQIQMNMTRPEHRLRITSVPNGAAVKVNGRSAGTTPASVAVNGFEQASVTVSLDGYKSWSTRIYVREPTTSVSAKLAADKAAPAKAAPPKPAPRPAKRSK